LKNSEKRKSTPSRKVKEDNVPEDPIRNSEDVLNQIPLMICLLNTTRRENFFNKGWKDFFGDFNNDCDVWIDRIHNADRKKFLRLYLAARKKEKSFSLEFRVLDKEDVHKWIFLTFSKNKDKSGKFNGFFGTAIDITKNKMNEIKKDEFLTIASHELKGPLTMIKGYSELLSKTLKENDKEKMSQYLDKSIEGVNKLDGLVSELLDVSRIQTGKLEAHMGLLNITDLIGEIIKDYDRSIPSHKVVLVKSDTIYVSGDRLKLEQVIVNLIDNAVKYSPESKKVELSIERRRNFAIISVRDFGIGIKKKDQQRIFRRFYRTEKTENNVSGLGIGLYISKEISALHEGKIKVESELGKGSVFLVLLPLLRAEN
jgi:signal transduction histidine kinase